MLLKMNTGTGFQMPYHAGKMDFFMTEPVELL
jgi:hypothetical protein